MTRVRDEHISNKEICRQFGGIPTIERLIARRQLKWVGKIIRMDERQIPPKILTCFIGRKRCTGRRFRTTRDAIYDSLCKIWPNLQPDGDVKWWRRFAKFEGYWGKCADAVAEEAEIPVFCESDWTRQENNHSGRQRESRNNDSGEESNRWSSSHDSGNTRHDGSSNDRSKTFTSTAQNSPNWMNIHRNRRSF